MGPVSLKNSIQKHVFWDGRNFAPGHFCPQSRHLVCLANKIGEVRFSKKIQTENVVFGKNEFERAFEAKLSKVFPRNNLAPERTIEPIRPRKEVWCRFHQNITTENVVFEKDETSLWDTFAANRAI